MSILDDEGSPRELAPLIYRRVRHWKSGLTEAGFKILL
jgi:hypothetical protein